jgi:hypothetical protein
MLEQILRLSQPVPTLSLVNDLSDLLADKTNLTQLKQHGFKLAVKKQPGPVALGNCLFL